MSTRDTHFDRIAGLRRQTKNHAEYENDVSKAGTHSLVPRDTSGRWITKFSHQVSRPAIWPPCALFSQTLPCQNGNAPFTNARSKLSKKKKKKKKSRKRDLSLPKLLPKPQSLPEHPIDRRRRTVRPAAMVRQVIPCAGLWARGFVNCLRLLQEDGVVDLGSVEGRLDGRIVDELRQEGPPVVAEADAALVDLVLRGGAGS